MIQLPTNTLSCELCAIHSSQFVYGGRVMARPHPLILQVPVPSHFASLFWHTLL
jgi:hypothetical protein